MSFIHRSGFGGMDVTMKNGRRFSTYSGYIKPILDRRNLKIYRYAEVTKVLTHIYYSDRLSNFILRAGLRVQT